MSYGNLSRAKEVRDGSVSFGVKPRQARSEMNPGDGPFLARRLEPPGTGKHSANPSRLVRSDRIHAVLPDDYGDRPDESGHYEPAGPVVTAEPAP